MTEKTQDVYQNETIVADMVERYTEVSTDEERAAVVASLAAELGKSVQSIRSKLVREGVYVAKERKTKTGEAVISKSALVDQIGEALGVTFTDGEGTSLEKATKSTLKKILGAAQVRAEAEEAA